MLQRVAAAGPSTAAPRVAKSARDTPSAGVKPDITFAVEPFSRVANELRPLFLRHHREIEPPEVPLAVAWDECLRLENFGYLRPLIVRDRGAAVGYIANILRPGLWCRDSVQGYVEAFYLEPTYRSGWLAYRMFKENDRLMRKWKVRRIFITAEYVYQTGRVAVIFNRLGYSHTADVYSKVLT